VSNESTTIQAVIFQCSRCGRDITPRLTLLADKSKVVLKDAVDLLPPGHYIPRDAIAEGENFYESMPGDFLVNLRDLLKLMPTGNRNGCCGCHGCDGPNLKCKCGNVLATEHSDCWMPTFVVLHLNSIHVVPSK
jgi:hypothetical protein